MRIRYWLGLTVNLPGRADEQHSHLHFGGMEHVGTVHLTPLNK